MKVFCYFINSKDILRRFKYSMLKSMLPGLCYPISILFIFDFIFLSYLINMFSVYLFWVQVKWITQDSYRKTKFLSA